MLSCEQVLQGLWQFLDKELDEDGMEHMKKHVALCRGCFSRVEFERVLRVEMRKKTEHCCPEKVKNQIKKILDQF